VTAMDYFSQPRLLHVAVHWPCAMLFGGHHRQSNGESGLGVLLAVAKGWVLAAIVSCSAG